MKYIKLVFFIFLIINSCNYVDVSGLFVSSFVDDRFREKDNLDDFKAPPVIEENNFSFLFITDLHYYTNDPDYFTYIEKNRVNWNISFIVVGGDIAQNGLTNAFDFAINDFKRTSLPIYPVLGNHDLYNGGFKNFKKYFGRSIYDFNIGNTLFIVLDTANGTLGYYQKQYLSDKLKNTDKKNKILLTHYSLIDKENESATAYSNTEEVYYIKDLCRKYGVNYVISGHLHNNIFHDIDGTKYISVGSIKENTPHFLKVTISGEIVKHELF